LNYWFKADSLKEKTEHIMQTEINEHILKQVFKDALLEMLEEKRSVFQDIIVEALEDIALSHAIDEGKDSGTASRNEIFSILGGNS
jgi:uncharacterized protein YaaW (UPF0174 family)